MLMKQKIKGMFLTIFNYISFPYNLISTRKVDKWLNQVAAEDGAALLTDKDVEFLRSIGVETDLETLRKETIRNKK